MPARSAPKDRPNPPDDGGGQSATPGQKLGRVAKRIASWTSDTLIDTALRRVPGFVWVIGGAALLALAGIIIRWGFNLATLTIPSCIIVVAAVVLMILWWISKLPPKVQRILATIAVCCFFLFALVAVCLVVASAVKNSPWPLKEWISQHIAPDPKKRARAAAKKVVSKIDSVSIRTNPQRRLTHINAVGCLRSIADLDVQYEKKEIDSNGKKTKLAPKDLAANRKKRAEMLVQFRKLAEPVVSDWKAIVEAVNFTESNIDVIAKTDGLENYANTLRGNLSGWTAMRDDLNKAISLAAGKEDGLVADSDSQLPVYNRLGYRLGLHLQGPLETLRAISVDIVAAASSP